MSLSRKVYPPRAPERPCGPNYVPSKGFKVVDGRLATDGYRPPDAPPAPPSTQPPSQNPSRPGVT